MRQAYLFEENGRWYAYEHSANRIEKFVKGFVDFRHKVQDVCGRIKVEIDLSILEKCSITPVSYTHLDVYKRQRKTCTHQNSN